MTLIEPSLVAPSLAWPQSEARLALLQRLKQAGYRFVTPSVATHRRVLAREGKSEARDLRDVFGWSLPFDAQHFGGGLTEALSAAGGLQTVRGLHRSAFRVASLGTDLFLHSAFPANSTDAVFFGPDSYRFANFLNEELRDAPRGGLLVDIGCGSGVGAVVAARLVEPERTVLIDLNAQALALARVNMAAAGLYARFICADGLGELREEPSLVVANPPFIAGQGGATYRDGGDLRGARLSLDWSLAGADRLARGGRLLLYTGSAIVEGQDVFHTMLREQLDARRFRLTYRELDPDIFGGQLGAPDYHDTERIAAVGLRIERLD